MTREIALEILKSLDVYRGDIDQAIQFAIKVLEQEPTTQNNLGVDCIDRQAAITFVCKNTKEILKDTMPLEVKLSDDYLYENVAKIMRNPKELPPVTPTHKKGKWICVHHIENKITYDSWKCSECQHDFDSEEESMVDFDEYKYCPMCGAKME